ncbi:MAG: hypothetical protein V2G42_02410 [bacterium JZ-2024 1]
MDRKIFVTAGILFVLTGCGITERLSSKAVRNDSMGIYLRVPKNWTAGTEGEAIVITEPSGTKIQITSATLPAQSEVLGTDQHSADLIRKFSGKKYKTELQEGWRLNGFYTRTVKAEKGDELEVLWVTAIPRIVTVYEVRMTGKKAQIEGNYARIAEILKRDFLFTKINAVLFDTPLWTVTSSNYGGYTFGLLVLVCIVFMGRYFFIDLWRLIRAPSDVFRDLARGEGFIYPLFWILLAAFLAGAIYGCTLPGEIAKAEHRISQQAEGVRATVQGMTTDPYLQELLVQDARERAIQPLVTYLEVVLFYIPLAVLAAWGVFSFLLFLVLKILRGRLGLFATMKSVTIVFALWSLAGGLIYTGLTAGNTIQQYAGYAIAGWGVFLMLVMAKETGRVGFGVGLVGLAIAAGAVGYGLNYVKTSQFEPVMTRTRAALSPNRALVDVFNTPFSAAPGASSAQTGGSAASGSGSPESRPPTGGTP